MSVETLMYTALKTLVSNHVYRVVAPPESPLPRITFQQVGGEAINFMEGGKPSKKRARMQLNCWGLRHDDVMALARLAEDAMRTADGLQATVLLAPIAIYEADTKLFGSMQDFSVVYDD